MALNYSYPPNAATTGAEGSGCTVEEHLALIRRHCHGDSADARAIASVYYGVEAMGSPDFSLALSRALNDWLLAEYIGADERLCASIVVPPHYPVLGRREDRAARRHRSCCAGLATCSFGQALRQPDV